MNRRGGKSGADQNFVDLAFVVCEKKQHAASHIGKGNSERPRNWGAKTRIKVHENE